MRVTNFFPFSLYFGKMIDLFSAFRSTHSEKIDETSSPLFPISLVLQTIEGVGEIKVVAIDRPPFRSALNYENKHFSQDGKTISKIQFRLNMYIRCRSRWDKNV